MAAPFNSTGAPLGAAFGVLSLKKETKASDIDREYNKVCGVLRSGSVSREASKLPGQGQIRAFARGAQPNPVFVLDKSKMQHFISSSQIVLCSPKEQIPDDFKL
jgi:hypothetical protein